MVYLAAYYEPCLLQIDYPEVHGGGRMHRPPHPHPITDHRQVNLVFDDTVNISLFFTYFWQSHSHDYLYIKVSSLIHLSK